MRDFLRDFFSSNLGLVWFDLVVYQVSTFYYVWNWSKSLCAGGCGGVVT